MKTKYIAEIVDDPSTLLEEVTTTSNLLLDGQQAIIKEINSVYNGRMIERRNDCIFIKMTYSWAVFSAVNSRKPIRCELK